MSYGAFSTKDPIQSKLDALVDPAVTDDSSKGYVVGSHWVNTVGNSSWVCVDSTAGAAIWQAVSVVTSVFGRTGIVVPAVGDYGEADILLDGDVSTQAELNASWNGVTLEGGDILVASDGVTWTLTYEKTGGGDIRMRFGSQTYTFDATPIASVNLTAGTATVPQINYVYVVEAAGVLTLTASTTGFAYSSLRVATVYCQDVVNGAVDGAFKVHVWIDHVVSGTGEGHVADINAKLRALPASWTSGAAGSDLVVSSPDAWVSVASGQVFRLHQHTFPARDMQAGDPAWIVNDPTTAFKRITTFDDITQDSAGGSINGRWFSVILWGVVSEVAADCKLFINLPAGTYNTAARAVLDANGYANYNIPPEFIGTGFLIARYNVQGQNAGAWVQDSKVDLRGLTPAGSPSGAGGITSHGDLSDLLVDDHPQYVPVAGTRAQDAALFTERAAKVNTSVAGKSEIWLDNYSTKPRLRFTDEAGLDKWIPTSSTVSNTGILVWSGVTGELLNSSTFTFGAGKFWINTATARIQLKETAAITAPPAAAGAFYVKSDTPNTPHFVDDTGVDIRLGTRFAVNFMGRAFPSANATWYTQDYYSPFSDGSNWDVAAGTGADPLIPNGAWMCTYIAPYDLELQNMRLHYQVSATTVTGKFRLYKVVVANDSSTQTYTQLGADLSINAATNAARVYIVDQLALTGDTVSAGDKIVLTYIHDTNYTSGQFSFAADFVGV